ncbi:uncharacterized protein BDZ99DRAFT_146284 [Mytilinidion resinicola]|uniref:Uncharacterized protein n=1 Tax=Mytilinidion resinicola TaxID=574789 RepID=A0A6A6Y8S5_9PEZI|nr:uncharacterized protein BDZ99DRAFT_146284 [Mytilinidion resinicola]KAF2804958.1 hypothetical protein BDZ99DRAFT_146284 [Mytilinidion resinicola]
MADILALWSSNLSRYGHSFTNQSKAGLAAYFMSLEAVAKEEPGDVFSARSIKQYLVRHSRELHQPGQAVTPSDLNELQYTPPTSCNAAYNRAPEGICASKFEKRGLHILANAKREGSLVSFQTDIPTALPSGFPSLNVTEIPIMSSGTLIATAFDHGEFGLACTPTSAIALSSSTSSISSRSGTTSPSKSAQSPDSLVFQVSSTAAAPPSTSSASSRSSRSSKSSASSTASIASQPKPFSSLRSSTAATPITSSMSPSLPPKPTYKPVEGPLSCNDDKMSTCQHGSVKPNHIDETAKEICTQLQNKDFYPNNTRINGYRAHEGVSYNFFVEWDMGCMSETRHHFDDNLAVCEDMFKATVFNCPNNQGSGGNHTEGCVRLGFEPTCMDSPPPKITEGPLVCNEKRACPTDAQSESVDYVARSLCDSNYKNNELFTPKDGRWEGNTTKITAWGAPTLYTAYMEWDTSCTAETEHKLDADAEHCMQMLTGPYHNCTNGGFGE